jgi:Domain of unknown function (DUF5801)
VTIGVGNQTIDPNEGAWFLYVDNPTSASVGKLGLTQTTADDADTIGFNGTNPTNRAQVEIVQVGGGSPATVKLEAWDITLNQVDTNNEARAFAVNPIAIGGNSPVTAVPQRNITEVKVFNSSGTLIFYDVDNAAPPIVNTGGITATFTSLSATVDKINKGYTIEFATDGEHDVAKITGVSGKFDIGGFNLVNNRVATTSVGDKLSVEDDGPTTDLAPKAGAELRLDESAGASATDTNADDETKSVTDTNDIGFATITAANLFTETTDFGTDGKAASDSKLFELTLSAAGADSGLTDTASKEAVVLTPVNGVIEGRTETGDDLVLTISVDKTDGDVEVHQYRAVVHGDPTDPDEPILRRASTRTWSASSLPSPTMTVTRQ